MFGLVVTFFIAIKFVENVNEEYIETCFNIAGYKDKKFSVFFNKDLTFFPKNMFVKMEISDEKSKYDIRNTLNFHAEKIEGTCSDSGLDHPSYQAARREDTHLVIELYFKDTSLYFEHFEAFAGREFPDTLIELKGLEGYAKIKVHYRPDITRFPFFDKINVDYFNQLGKIKERENLCILLFKKGEPIVFIIDGSELKDKMIYDHANVYIQYHSTTMGNIEFQYFSKAYFCSETMDEHVTRFFVDKTVTKIYFQIKQKEIDLTVHYEKTTRGFVLESQSREIKINPLEIIPKCPKDGFSHSDGMLIYTTKNLKIKCHQMDAYSYVDEIRSKRVVLKRYGRIQEYSDATTEIKSLRPGTEEEITQCLDSAASN